MASAVYHNTLKLMMDGSIDLGSDDIRTALVMTNTTCDTNLDAAFLADFTLDECDSTGYSRFDHTTLATADDDTNDWAWADLDDAVFTMGGDSTRAIQGALVYKHVTNDSDSIPIAFLQFSSNYTDNGAELTVLWNAAGWLQARLAD